MKTILPVLVGVSLALAQATGKAEETEQKPLKLSIEQHSLRDALNEWAQQTGNQLIAEIKGDFVAPKVVGTLTAGEALEQLLKGTSLTYRWMGERLVAVSEKPPTVPAALRSIGADGAQQALQVAKFSGDADGESFPVSDLTAQNTAPLAGGRASRDTIDTEALEEILVTGTHIRGSQPAGSNVIVVSREAIDRSGYGRLQDVIADLPQNFKGAGEEFNQVNGNVSFSSEIQLRGLGTGTTLTLVNGLRQPSGGSLGAFVDISSIPVAAIERVEILADGASAIYGSDAIGGVANIILRKDFEGAETRLRYATADGGGEELQLSQVFGASFGRGSALIGYQYLGKDPLGASDREYTARNGDMTVYGGTDFRVAQQRWRSTPGNVICPAGRTDCVAGTPALAIPAGQDGSSLTPAELLPGVINFADNVTDTQILPDNEVHSVFLSASYDMTDAWTLHTTGRYNKRDSDLDLGPRSLDATVPASNPFYVDAFGNGLPVRVAYDLAKDMGPVHNSTEVETLSVAAGAVGQLGHDWQLKLDGSYSEETALTLTDFFDSSSATAQASLAAALADTNPATALNLFGDGGDNNPQTLSALRSVSRSEGISRIKFAGLSFDGPIFGLPGGAARLAVGADFRNESQSIFARGSGQPQERDVYAGFAELSLPIVGPANALTGMRRLDVTLAGRYEDYSDFGSSVDPKIGLTFKPFESLALRGTWGTSFRAPPIYQSNIDVITQSALAIFFPDPQSPTRFSKVLVLTGNNENLEAETATTWTAGFDIMPASLPQLRISATYFDIDYKDKIQATVPFLAQEAQFAALITRNPSQAEIDRICTDPAVTVLGTCTQPPPIAAILDARVRNIASVSTSGVDLTLNYTLATQAGNFAFDLGGTYMFELDRALTPTAPTTDVLDTVQNPLSLRVRGGVSWDWNGWIAGAALRYTGDYEDPASIPARSVDSLLTGDLRFGYKTSQTGGWFDDTEVLLNVVNVTDERPPFVNVANGYDGANFTILGRFASLQIAKTF